MMLLMGVVWLENDVRQQLWKVVGGCSAVLGPRPATCCGLYVCVWCRVVVR